MNFREFEKSIDSIPFFNLNDIRKIDPGFHRQQLNYWRNQRLIRPLVGGYYILEKENIDESKLLMIANKLYEPSYVSLESALAYYHIIPETVFGVTSVSSRKTTKFESELGIFRYKSIHSKLFFGYEVINTEGKLKYKMASLEKAILDYLYLHAEINSIENFEMLRWNIEQLEPIINVKKLENFLLLFDKITLKKRAHLLMEYIHA